MEKQQKQVCDIRAGKGITIAQSNEHLRNGQQYAYNNKVSGNMDPTRVHLNFEVGNTQANQGDTQGAWDNGPEHRADG